MKNILNRRLGLTLSVALVCFGLSTAMTAMAAKGGNGNGNGNGDDGDNVIQPASITFTGGHEIASDGGGAYVHGVGGVEAFIGSAANTGNIWLRTIDAPARGLWLDFSRCESVDPADCTPPFAAEVNGGASIKVEADSIFSRGIYDMAVGTFIHPPMRVYYIDAGQMRFVDFNNVARGGDPCKNQGVVNVEVEH